MRKGNHQTLLTLWNFDDSIDCMHLCDADRKFIDNHLQITKNESKEIEKKNKKKIQIVSNGIENCKLGLLPLILV